MSAHRTPALVRSRAYGVAASLILASGVVAGCGPSQDEIRADINETCVDLIEDLSELDADPAFPLLAVAADEAGFEFGAAAFQVEGISAEGPADEFASALHALSDSYDDLEKQVATRDYALLAQTRMAGEAALADALSSAESIGATDCMGIGVRVEYFAIAADGAEAAAARIAPTGDYVTDVDAACARYANDTFAVSLKLNLQSLIGDHIEVTPDAGDYIEAVEDLLVIGIALDVLVSELAVLEPSDDAEAAHAQLIEGYQSAIEGFRSLRNGGEGEEVVASAERVEEAAERLGVDCGL